MGKSQSRNILTEHNTELNEVIYAGAKLVSDTNRTRKSGWEMRLEGQIKKMRRVQGQRKENTQEYNEMKRQQEINLTQQPEEINQNI